MTFTTNTQAAHPFQALDGFVRAHLLRVNYAIVASCTLVATLDFLAPRLSIFPKLVYGCTAALAVAMLVAALVPLVFSSAIARAGFNFQSNGTPLWRRAGWQFLFIILLGISILGDASVARANQGGWIVENIPAIKPLQDSMLKIQPAVVDIGEEVNGAKQPGNPVSQAELLKSAALSLRSGRPEVRDLLAQRSTDKSMLFHGSLSERSLLTQRAALVVRNVFDAADLSHDASLRYSQMPTGDKDLDLWNDAIGCLRRTSGGVSMIEVAALLGDINLFNSLKASGMQLPDRPLVCAWQSRGLSGQAIVDIDPDSGKVLGTHGE